MLPTQREGGQSTHRITPAWAGEQHTSHQGLPTSWHEEQILNWVQWSYVQEHPHSMNYSPWVVLKAWRSDLKGAHDFEEGPQSQKHFHNKSKINCLFQSRFLKSVQQSFPEEANV